MKLSILLTLLTSKLAAPQEEDLSKGILEAIDMDSYRVEKKAAGLRSNFKKKVKKPFSLDAALDYLKKLLPDGKVKAAEYAWRSPEFVQTAVRSALQQEPWFSKPDNR